MTPSLRLIALALAVASVVPSPVRAQDTQPAQQPTGVAAARPTVTALRVDAPPRIDGRLDDPPWRAAASVHDFVQSRPVEGDAASERTDVYLAYDSEHLYVGIRAHYTSPDLIRATRVDRDRTESDDSVTISFDPFLDRLRGYAFTVNAYGVQGDAMLSADGATNTAGDTSWDALFETAGALVDEGWTAEMAIPFKSLRYPSRASGEEHMWGLQVQREIRSKDETISWSPISVNVMGFLPQMGLLRGMRDLSTKRNLEVLPTFTAVQFGRLQSPADFRTRNIVEGGLNVKYGLSSNLTLDATYNPDFSQIESDRAQIEINQRFPLFYPELRTFFLEGQEIYRNTGGAVTIVHTRTIVDPKYGAKLTGKIARATLALIAANNEAPGDVEGRADPAFGKTAQVMMGRVKFDLYRDSYVGGIVTDREFLDSRSRVGFLDGTFRLGQNHRTTIKAALSDHRDREGVARDGLFLDAAFVKEGRSFRYVLARHLVEPTFRTDVGFVRRGDIKRTLGNIYYRWWPERWVINWGPGFNYDRVDDYSGTLQDEARTFRLDAQFARNITAGATMSRTMERYEDREFQKTRISVSGQVNTSRRMSFTADVNHGDEPRFVADPFLGRSTGYNVSVSLRPFPRLRSDLSLSGNRFRGPRIAEDFDVNILHALTTFQFTDRLLVRNTLEHNTLDATLGANVLVTYRINAGTVFFVGYDDRYRDGSRIDGMTASSPAYQRTNRAIFTKLQYLFRY